MNIQNNPSLLLDNSSIILKNSLVILDLDETLIYSADASSENEDYDFCIYNNNECKYQVYKRPHLDEFLTYLFQNFKVGIWSSGSEGYVNEIRDNILKEDQIPEFTWNGNRCTKRYNNEMQERVFVKRLNKIFQSNAFRKKGFRKEKILIIDDSPEKGVNNRGNLITCMRFYGDQKDTELLKIKDLLEEIKFFPDWRSVDKDLRARDIKLKKNNKLAPSMLLSA